MLRIFHPAVREWFTGAFEAPTRPQQLGWPAIARGESTLILAPTGSGKTLTAFLWCLNRLMFPASSESAANAGGRARKRDCRVIYVSPLKALAVDVERNLRAPLAGIANIAQAQGVPMTMPVIGIRTGDTPANERAKFLREAADILITTPESLFLLLTSQARERLTTVETVIIDEIHALVPGKRGAHLALSLERLEGLRPPGAPPLQRIGLSATQRPLDEVARFLGGAQARPTPKARRRKAAGRAKAAMPLEEVEAELHEEFTGDDKPAAFRPVTIVNASEKKQLKLTIEVPVEDMAKLGTPVEIPSGPAAAGGAVRTSIWASIHPRLLDLIRSHQSTLLFVNSRG